MDALRNLKNVPSTRRRVAKLLALTPLRRSILAVRMSKKEKNLADGNYVSMKSGHHGTYGNLAQLKGPPAFHPNC